MHDYKDIGQMHTACVHEKTPFKTVILDSLTEYYVMEMRLRLALANRSGEPPKGLDYGETHQRVLDFLRDIQQANRVHFLATCWERKVQDAMNGSLYTLPDLPGQVATKGPGYFHVVGYLLADVRKKGDAIVASHVLQTQPYGRRYTKDRTSNPLIALNEPSIALYYDIMYKGLSIAPRGDDDIEREEIDPSILNVFPVVSEVVSSKGTGSMTAAEESSTPGLETTPTETELPEQAE